MDWWMLFANLLADAMLDAQVRELRRSGDPRANAMARGIDRSRLGRPLVPPPGVPPGEPQRVRFQSGAAMNEIRMLIALADAQGVTPSEYARRLIRREYAEKFGGKDER